LTLEQVFRKLPNTPINLDIKVESEELTNETERLILQYKRERFTVWGSRFHSISTLCYKKRPDIPRFFSIWSVFRVYLGFYSGLLPFLRIQENALEIPLVHEEIFDRFFSRWPSWRRKLLFLVVSSLTMRPALFRHLRERGIYVIFWTLNSETEFDEAFRLGADGVMTDYPSLLTNYLKAKSMWP